MDEPTAIIIDNGSGVCKAGFAGDDTPHFCFPNVVGTPKHTATMVSTEEARDRRFIGAEAQENRGLLTMTYPISHGVVQDWELMEQIWDNLFKRQLKVRPEDHSVLLTEAPLNPKRNRERMLEIMFDTFGIQSIYVAMGAVLSLYSAGRTTGVVIDVGDGITHTVPIYEGFTKTFAIGRMQLAGRDITEYLCRILHERGHVFETSAEKEIVRDIKEQHAFVALDYEQEMKSVSHDAVMTERTYELPDGQVIAVGSERFRCAEILFRPSFIGREREGLAELLNTTIMRCGLDARKVHYSNIVLSGGCTLLPGFGARLTRDVANLAPNSAKVKVISTDERKESVWMGGSILASLTTFRDMWVTREEYNENGPAVVHRKCLYAA